ncbi:hypothetical protein SRABI83_00854 [Arthrobacter sp. Bi83]|jgi:hypothetical protein|uniref:hypothetical protein n=1 Tax=Arthrobacter sp. Bi83 TaxID=2822353 RepID=UPI001D33C082|nr:hypothetical protein [Arthrobacter sp. Bi83]CAH0156925.1 hypothetical protein SRABI83_00854 [Arthrobacter sp. Bi83]
MAIVQAIEYVGDIAAAVDETAKKVASAAQEVEKTLKAVYEAVDTDDTVAIRMANLTNYSFLLTKEAHKQGKWADDPGLGHNVLPPAQIDAWQLAGCLTKDSGLLTGTKGKLHYTTEVGGDKHFGVFHWDNPGPVSLQRNDAWAVSGKLDFENGKLVITWPPTLDSDVIKVMAFISPENKARALYVIVSTDLSPEAEEHLTSKLQLVN